MYNHIDIEALATQLAGEADLGDEILRHSSFAVVGIKSALDASLFEVVLGDVGGEVMRGLKLQIVHKARLKRGIIDITTQPY